MAIGNGTIFRSDYEKDRFPEVCLKFSGETHNKPLTKFHIDILVKLHKHVKDPHTYRHSKHFLKILWGNFGLWVLRKMKYQKEF